MSQNPPPCSLLVDASFGPWAGSCRGGLDFTLLFEESILTLPLASIFLVFLPLRFWILVRQDVRVFSSPLRLYKVVTIICWIAFQLALLIIWTSGDSGFSFTKTKITIPTVSLSFAASLGFAVLSWYEHMRSVKPAAVLDTYLFLSILLDTARARTLWLMRDGSTIPLIFTCTIGIRCILTILESSEKRSILLEPYAASSKEELSGSFSRGVFFWLTSLFLNGYKSILSLQDLHSLDEKLRTQKLQAKLEIIWANVSEKTKGRALIYAWAGAQKWELLVPVLPRLCLIGFTFSQPFLVTRAIDLASAPNEQRYNNYGYGLIGAYILAYTGIAISYGQYQHRMNRAAIMMRGSVIPCIMRKTLRLPVAEVNTAAALSLINTDIETIIPGVVLFHEIWAGFVEISIAIYLLNSQIGAACAVPIAFSFAILLVTGFLAVPIGTSQAAWIEASQKRVAATSNTLGKIQWIRISGLGSSAFAMINKLRIHELEVSRDFRVFTMWVLTLATCTPILSPVLTLVTFALLALRNDDTVTISKIFTSLSLFVLLSSPLTMIIVTIPSIAAAVTSFGRIQNYLNASEHEDIRYIHPNTHARQEKIFSRNSQTSSLYPPRINPTAVGDSLVELQHVHHGSSSAHAAGPIITMEGKFTWSEGDKVCLNMNEFAIRRATLTIILGPVGCGKSTLLKCMLGEMAGFDGRIAASYATIAYCDQIPYLPNSTVRDLIVSTSEYEPKWFNTVVAACALEQDLKQWPREEFSCVGSKGISLSGGQKQRLAIARAIYSRSEVFMFDDSFSGLDSRTEGTVFENLLGTDGLLRQGDTTVILASSDASRASYANQIIMLAGNGQVSTYETLKDTSSYAELLESSKRRKNEEPSKNRGNNITKVDQLEHASSPLLPGVNLHTDNRRQLGDSTVYKFYLKSAGWRPSTIFVTSMIVFAFCDAFPNIWLKWWAEASVEAPNQDLEKWLTVYAALAVASMICLLIGTWQVFIECITNSGIFFHDLLLETISRAKMHFFSTVDAGVTINRFSQDLQLIDMELPANALGVASTFAFCVAQAVMMSVASKYFAITIPFVCFVFYVIQHFYLRTSRQMRFLDIEHKAPLYSQLLETLNALVTIRAFKWQMEIEEKNWQLLDDSQRPAYLLFCLQQWLIFAVNMVVAFMAVILITLTTTLRQEIGPGYMGIALINIIAFGETTKALIQTWVGLEISIGAVARIKNFAEETEQEESNSDVWADTLPDEWPSAGNIEFDDATAAYPTTLSILKNITLSIGAGEKVGICGRTGSGKSSLLQALFRMLPITNGAIHIDNIALSTVPPSIVRSRLVGVPQESYILPATVRQNLDPASAHSDASIITALQNVSLWATAVLPRGGLDAKIDDQFFSHGQAQLFALARAMLRKPRILVLDEITSSLDRESERMVRDVVEKDFSGVTILAVAHRLEFIKDFDRVVVLSEGKIVEVGVPQELMRKEGGKWRELVELQKGSGDFEGGDVAGGDVAGGDEMLASRS